MGRNARRHGGEDGGPQPPGLLPLAKPPCRQRKNYRERGIATCTARYYIHLVTTISLKLPDTLLRELKDAAAARRMPQSAIVRECLEQGLRKRSSAKRKPSCL